MLKILDEILILSNENTRFANEPIFGFFLLKKAIGHLIQVSGRINPLEHLRTAPFRCVRKQDANQS